MLTYLYLLIKYSSNKTDFYSGTRFCPLKNKNVTPHSYLLEIVNWFLQVLQNL